MATPPIHIGQTVIFRFQAKDEDGTVLDISSAFALEIFFRDPCGLAITKTATITNAPGTDGRYQYKTLTADLNLEGAWKAQGHVEFTAGDNAYTRRQSFEVEERIV